jgi:hypothetical protein
MQVDFIKTHRELVDCVDMYLGMNDETFMRSDRRTAIKSLDRKIRNQKFVRCLREESEIVSWIFCEVVKLDHTDYKNFQQIYYASRLTGVKAVRSVVRLHDEMYHHARQLDVAYCVSPGSHLDERNTFARILEKNNWKRRGFVAVREVIRVSGESAPTGTQVDTRRGPFQR